MFLIRCFLLTITSVTPNRKVKVHMHISAMQISMCWSAILYHRRAVLDFRSLWRLRLCLALQEEDRAVEAEKRTEKRIRRDRERERERERESCWHILPFLFPSLSLSLSLSLFVTRSNEAGDNYANCFRLSLSCLRLRRPHPHASTMSVRRWKLFYFVLLTPNPMLRSRTLPVYSKPKRDATIGGPTQSLPISNQSRSIFIPSRSGESWSRFCEQLLCCCPLLTDLPSYLVTRLSEFLFVLLRPCTVFSRRFIG